MDLIKRDKGINIFDMTDSERIDMLIKDYKHYLETNDLSGIENVVCELYEKYGIVNIEGRSTI